jgi:hypothetical protein
LLLQVFVCIVPLFREDGSGLCTRSDRESIFPDFETVIRNVGRGDAEEQVWYEGGSRSRNIRQTGAELL